MKYEKQWASIDDQIEFLTKVKGLEVENIDELRLALRNVGYYRLSAYWLPYKKGCGQIVGPNRSG